MKHRHSIPFVLAVHESGHALARWYTGDFTDFVVVRTDDEIATEGPYIDRRDREVYENGFTDCYSRYKPLGDDISDFDEAIRNRMRNAMEIQLIHTLAGPIAEARHSRKSLKVIMFLGGWGDYNFANKCAKEFATTSKNDFLHTAEKRVRAIFKEPGIWPAVLAVAMKLQSKRVLNGDEVSKIIQKVTKQRERKYTIQVPYSD